MADDSRPECLPSFYIVILTNVLCNILDRGGAHSELKKGEIVYNDADQYKYSIQVDIQAVNDEWHGYKGKNEQPSLSDKIPDNIPSNLFR